MPTTPIEVTPPDDEPVSLFEMSTWARDPAAEDETLLQSLIKAARQWFEAALDRQLVTATWEMRYASFAEVGELPYPPLQTVEINYDDPDGNEQTLATSVYNVVTSATPGYVELAAGQIWPQTAIGPEVVRVEFTAGYGDPSTVPDLVKTGIKMLAGTWYEKRVEPGEIPAAVKAIAITAGAYRF